MKKVLILVEDYNDQSSFFQLFKRMGFDCDSIPRDSRLNDLLITFKPELIVIGAMGVNFDFKRILPKFLKMNPKPKIAYLHRKKDPTETKPPYHAPSNDIVEHFDASIELPVDPRALFKMVCQIFSLPEEVVMEKLEKQMSARSDGDNATFRVDTKGTKEKLQIISGGKKTENYSSFLKSHPIDENVPKAMPREPARKAMRELAESITPEEKVRLDDIESQKRTLVKAMMKK